jgi:drug/metabolite transporter (DMT)-like permease
MSDAGVSGVVSSFYTYSIALVLAALYFAKHWHGVFKLPLSIILLSLVAGWTNLSYVLAIIDGEVMRVMLLFYLSPLWTLILAHFWLKEETHLAGVIAIIASLLGAYIMLYDPVVSGFPVPRNRAEWLGLSSGFGFALTNVMTRKSVHLTLRAKSFAIWIGVIVVCLIAMPLMQVSLLSPAMLTPANWLVMLLIAVLLIAATLLVQYGVTLIKATIASVLFLFELVVAAIAAYYLTDETMDINEWIGGALIVAASVFAAFNHKD